MHRLLIPTGEPLMADQVRHVSNRVHPPRASPGILVFICGLKGVLTSLIMSLDRGIQQSEQFLARRQWLLIVHIYCQAQITLLITNNVFAYYLLCMWTL